MCANFSTLLKVVLHDRALLIKHLTRIFGSIKSYTPFVLKYKIKGL